MSSRGGGQWGGGAPHCVSSDEMRSSPGWGRQPRLRRLIFAALSFAQLALSATAWAARKAAACCSAAAFACLCSSFSAAAAASLRSPQRAAVRRSTSFSLPLSFRLVRSLPGLDLLSLRFLVSADRSGRSPAFADARRCFWRLAVSADRSGRCPCVAAARRCFWRLAVSADRSGRARR